MSQADNPLLKIGSPVVLPPSGHLALFADTDGVLKQITSAGSRIALWSVGANVKSYGARGDGQMAFDAGITNGSPIVTSATALFKSTDVGKTIWVNDPTDGTNRVAPAKIIQWDSATQVRAAVNSSVTKGSCLVVWGTDDTLAFQRAFSDSISSVSATSLISGNPGCVYAPTGNYLISDVIYRNTGTNAQNFGPSFIGDGSNHTRLFVSPTIPVPANGEPPLIYGVGTGATFSGFSVNACNRSFPFQTDQGLIEFASAQKLRLDDIYMTGGASSAVGSMLRFLGASVYATNVVVQGGVITGSAMYAMDLTTVAGVFVGCMGSNFNRNVRIQTQDGRAPLQGPLNWYGTNVDEGGTSLEIINGGTVNIHGGFFYSSLVGGTTWAIHVDGTSKAWIRDSNAGRFGWNVGAVGTALLVDSGGYVYSSGNTWRGSDSSPAFLINNGTYVDGGGNDYRLYTSPTAFTAKTYAQASTGSTGTKLAPGDVGW